VLPTGCIEGVLAAIPLVVYQEFTLFLAVGTGENGVWRGRRLNLVKTGYMVGILGWEDL